MLAVSAGYFIHFDVEPSQNNKPQLAVEIQNPKVTVETENKQEEKTEEPEAAPVQNVVAAASAPVTPAVDAEL